MKIVINQKAIELRQYPNICPFCHHTITPSILSHYSRPNKKTVDIFMSCPGVACQRSFVSVYDFANSDSLQFSGEVIGGRIASREFSEIIKEISITFCTVYDQAYAAEQYSLLEICGVGYRKALEFLIKDYATRNHIEQEESIKKKILAKCIHDYVTDPRIKEVAKRAAWLGNDETHYVRKWEGHDLKSLKMLIDLTLHWIEAEVLTDTLISEMPEAGG